MTFRPLLPILAASSLFLKAEPLSSLQEASGTDKLHVELLNLANGTALLRRADGQEFDPPSPTSPKNPAATFATPGWPTEQKSKSTSHHSTKPSAAPLFASNGNLWNEATGHVA
ncbi:MAG: hypothetical protein ACJAQT_003975 [Akkermansiaceae bacterium]|jgi:hypothetical protein